MPRPTQRLRRGTDFPLGCQVRYGPAARLAPPRDGRQRQPAPASRLAAPVRVLLQEADFREDGTIWLPRCLIWVEGAGGV
jgi:hypothetical protein